MQLPVGRQCLGDDVRHQAIPSLGLGVVQTLVGPFQKVRARLARPQFGDAERSGDFSTRSPSGSIVQCLDSSSPADSVGGLDGVFEARAGKQDRELLAAEPRHPILAPHVLGQDFREQAQQPIADEMAETVVDQLKPVEIGERKTEIGAGAPRLVQFLGQRGVEKAAVADQRDRVAHSGFLRALKLVLQLQRLEPRLLELVAQRRELVAHVAIVREQREHDVVHGAGLGVLRQAFGRAVQPLRKGVTVGQVRLDKPGDRAQQPVDRLRLLGRMFGLADSGLARFDPDREAPGGGADRTRQE